MGWLEWCGEGKPEPTVAERGARGGELWRDEGTTSQLLRSAEATASAAVSAQLGGAARELGSASMGSFACPPVTREQQ